MILAAMTDTQLTIIVAAIPPTLIALGAFISSLLNRGANARTEKKVNEIAPKIEKVEAHVNSDATAKNAKIEAQEREIKNLTGLLAERKATAELLAQAAATTAAASAPAPTPAPAPAEPLKVSVISSAKEPVVVQDAVVPDGAKKKGKGL